MYVGMPRAVVDVVCARVVRCLLCAGGADAMLRRSNLANEHLQHFFNAHVFSMELAEYTKEGLDASKITFVDNSALLVGRGGAFGFFVLRCPPPGLTTEMGARQDMFSRKPLGFFALLDEESFYPGGNDLTLVQKFTEHFAAEPGYKAGARAGEPLFTIRHFAGDVEYFAGGFLAKNRDSLVSLDQPGSLPTPLLRAHHGCFSGARHGGAAAG